KPEDEAAFVDRVLSRGRLGKPEQQQTANTGVFDIPVANGSHNVLVLNIDDERRITGYTITPAKEERGGREAKEPPVASSSIPIALPFRGEWVVYWGGSTPESNPHLGTPAQRRAADLGKVDAKGSDRTGDGRKNTDYVTYGAEVLAVADGVVVTAVDGIPDNEPGVTNATHGGGNEIIIQHELPSKGGSIYSFYGQLQPGKHRVKRGSKVKRGDVIGIAGNSGDSSQPHLHFHVQDGPRMADSWGIEPVFDDVALVR